MKEDKGTQWAQRRIAALGAADPGAELGQRIDPVSGAHEIVTRDALGEDVVLERRRPDPPGTAERFGA